MGKSTTCDKNGLKKGPWTAEEDQKLIDYIQKHGHGRWRLLPKNAGLQRCGKSCRLRWTNYLRPDIKRGKFSLEEEETIIQLHGVMGNKWSAIAARLPGRTDNEIKNHWNTHIKKKLLKMGIDPLTHKPRLDLLQLYSILSSSLCNPSQLSISNLPGIGPSGPIMNQEVLNMAMPALSTQGNNTQNLSQQTIQENQLGCPQVPSQFQNLLQSQIQGITDLESGHFGNETEFIQANFGPLNYDGAANFGCRESFQCSWQAEQTVANRSSFDNMTSSNFSSVLCPPPSCSTTPLHSSSTTNYLNGSTEDERDSYCTNFLMFDLPNSLDGKPYSSRILT
ncbi:hypothetical protein Tsubulata_005378 [Turnera subulata]|uniref:Uncharacterized protein n=1 Tax=Turnera subulata TaxID=218843 RepID=A0A9Q0G3R3_9ROSI|nr:hypothetical protein Tsubulata_005378 [Turnera subulata]